MEPENALESGKTRDELWDELAACVHMALSKLALVDAMDFTIRGRSSEAFFLNVVITSFSIFTLSLLRELHNCLVTCNSDWGIVIYGPDSAGKEDVLAAIYQVAAADACDDQVVRQITADFNRQLDATS